MSNVFEGERSKDARVASNEILKTRLIALAKIASGAGLFVVEGMLGGILGGIAGTAGVLLGLNGFNELFSGEKFNVFPQPKYLSAGM